MNRILTSAEMFLCDRTEIETNTSSRALMYRAARACADAVKRILDAHPANGYVAVLCGSGNNGGDGILCARLLREIGVDARIVPAFTEEDSLSPECAYRCEEARAAGIPTLSADAFLHREEAPDAAPLALIVDALFGIGLTREPDGIHAALIDAANAYAASNGIPTVAIDIASGIFADTGKTSAHTFRASHTLAINNIKRGHLLYPGASCTGTLSVLDIGIPTAPLSAQSDDVPLYLLTDDDVRRLLPRRPQDSNKGSNGRILIVAGSKTMCGAAYLSALGAYRAGAGLVEIFTCEENRIPLQTLLPEAIVTGYRTDMDYVKRLDLITDSVSRASAIVCGPGMGQSIAACALVSAVLKSTTVPTVLDADALNLMADLDEQWEILAERRDVRKNDVPLPPIIMTPHPGELSRLTGISMPALLDDFITCAVSYARATQIIFNAKNTRSVITDGRTAFLNPTGTSALAKGGSGDVLTGITATLLAQGCEPLHAAALAAYLHGRAAERVTARMGARSPLASEIADALGEVFVELGMDV